MHDRSKANASWAARGCARLAIAFCVVVFGFGDAVERGLAGYSGVDAALTIAVGSDRIVATSTDHSGTHVDGAAHGDADMSGQVVGHGCHGCAALPLPMLEVASAPTVLGPSHGWASVPSAAGRKPLVDLPPPRA